MLSTFDGPLDLLLQMIEKNKLDICEFSLAKIADEYAEHLKSLELVDPEELSDFIYLSSRLIIIKTRQILFLGTEKEDEDSKELINQIQLYSEYKKISCLISNLYDQEYKYFEKIPEEFLKTEDFDFSKLTLDNINLDIFNRFFNTKPERIVIYKEKKTINQKIDYIKNYFITKQNITMSELFEEISKDECVVSLLGTLQLSKERFLNIYQNKNFDSILLEKEGA